MANAKDAGERLGVVAVARQIRDGKISSEELTRACLARIEARERREDREIRSVEARIVGAPHT